MIFHKEIVRKEKAKIVREDNKCGGSCDGHTGTSLSGYFCRIYGALRIVDGKCCQPCNKEFGNAVQ